MRDAADHLAHQAEPTGMGQPLPQGLGFAGGGMQGTDVPQNADETVLLSTAELTNGQINGQGGAVAAAGRNLAPDTDDALLAGVQVAMDVPVVLVAIGCRHQQAHVLAQHFGGGVTQKRFGGPVEAGDMPSRVDQHDGIDGRIQQGIEAIMGGGDGRVHLRSVRCRDGARVLPQGFPLHRVSEAAARLS